MGKSGGVFIVLAALVMSVIIWGNPLPKLIAAFIPQAPTALTISSLPASLDLSVTEAQLMSHVAALAQPRVTPAQKAAARSYLVTQLTTYGLAPTEQRYSTAAGEGVNVIAEIAGSDPTAGAIVLGAHYDTVVNSPGADDNGSAIATLLETARVLSAQTAPPAPATLKLVFFDQEEQQPDGSGLLGSLAFVQETDVSDVKGAVILDMVGYACRTEGCQTYPARLPIPNLPTTGDFLAVLGLQEKTDLLIGAFMQSAQSNWPLVLSLPIPQPTLKFFPDLLRSDHAPFWNQDIPAVFVSDTANFRNPHYHTAQDTVDTLDRSFFRGSAQHIVNAIASLLNQTAP
ncbi:MAG: M28 family peptidase [Phormidesmis sp.]